ncbi:hypothetical protein L1987_14912 [Smallanthus sonchifolius]|uniref:Uncharacterized protein n=1 Tax=Smallanthus sonchifolius TaxID=185202 RepID=A0ACB9J6C6_9ASTR|nr:hypothetical protein L1987_14912 [Smallanthus sonchifolius]
MGTLMRTLILISLGSVGSATLSALMASLRMQNCCVYSHSVWQIKPPLSLSPYPMGESFHEAWERFKGLCNDCPHHGIEDWCFVKKFYNGCSIASRGQLDTAAGGNMMMSKSLDECFDLFEDIAMSSYQSPHTESSQRGVMYVDSNTALAA